jgi:methyl-accepting chemotaxis protein
MRVDAKPLAFLVIQVLLGHLSISRRFLVVLLLGAAAPAFLSMQSLMSLKDALIEARSSEVRHLDEAAWTAVASYYDRAAKGLMTEAAAQEAAKDAVRAMRYDGMNYFFIWDMNGTGIAHGGNQNLEGKNFISGPDAEKKPGVADMVGKLVKVAKEQGEGFARYRIPKAGQTIPLDKIGYSKLFAPWGWAIGTGVYIADIDTQINEIFWKKAFSDLMVTAVVALLSFLLSRDLSQSLCRLTGAMKRLAAGDLSATVKSSRITRSGCRNWSKKKPPSKRRRRKRQLSS